MHVLIARYLRNSKEPLEKREGEEEEKFMQGKLERPEKKNSCKEEG